MLSVDFETTGVDAHEDRIVTASLVFSPERGQEGFTKEFLINPGVEIPEGATRVHGVTTEHAREHGMAPPAALKEIGDMIVEAGKALCPVVVFNAPYDLTMLAAEQKRHGLEPLTRAFGPVIDPFVIDKGIDRFRKGSRKLVDMCAHYGIRLDDAHNATADATGALHLARKLMELCPPGTDLRGLYSQQEKWKAEQASSFNDYLRRQGKTPDASGEWPMMTPR